MKTKSLFAIVIIFIILGNSPVFATNMAKINFAQDFLQVPEKETFNNGEGNNGISSNREIIKSPQILLKMAQEQGAVRVVVGLNIDFIPEGELRSPLAVDRQQQQIAQAQENVLKTLPGDVTVNAKFEIIPYMALTVDEEALQALLQSSEINYIQEDRLSAPTLASTIPLIGADVVHAGGTTGTGWTVAVLDSGVQWDHEFLGGAANSRVMDEACFSTTDAGNGSTSICAPAPHEADSDTALCLDGSTNICAHGTHVAGIVAGNQTYASVSYDGVAPEANVIAVQVFSRFPQSVCAPYGYTMDCVLSYESDQISGLQYVYSQRGTYNIAAVNMSLGGGRYYTEAACDADEAPTKAVIDSLRSVGIATVISSGNSSYKDSIGAPGCISTAVAVGATDDSDVVASFSNSSNLVELLAPGVFVDSSVPLDNGVIYDTYSGTSMAAPHVTGAWALIKQNNPTASVSEVLNVLQNTGVVVTDVNGIGIPRIQIDAALSTGEISGTVTDDSSGNPIQNALVNAAGGGQYNTTTDENGQYSLWVPAGNYDVTASTFGYQPVTQSNVAVQSGATTTADFALTTVPSYLVSGVVTDASTGWPLYARIDIPGYPGSPVWTNPTTGAYNVTLPSAVTHDFTVSAWVDGYTVVSRTVGPLTGPTTEDFALITDAFACSAPGYTSSATSLLSEDFESWPLQNGWNIVNNGGDCVWQAGSTDGDVNNTGGSGNYADADSDDCGNLTSMDTDLRTPNLDLTGQPDPVLEFKSDMFLWNGDIWDVDMSLDGGATWPINLLHREGSSYRGPETITLPMTGAGGSSNVRIRFRYQGDFDYWWQVDDVVINSVACTPTAGGLVVGNVYDGNTSAALNGVTVSNIDGYNTTSATMPDNPNVDDGFYTLFSPAGDKQFTASFTNYGDDVDTVTVVANYTVRHDFSLDAGKLSYLPTAIDVVIPTLTNTNEPLSLINSGGVTANFAVLELGTAVYNSLDDGSMDNNIGLTNGGQFVWFNRFSPASTSFPFSLTKISAIVPDTVAMDAFLELAVWEDTDGDGDPGSGANFLYSETVQVINNDGTTWNEYNLSTPVILNGPGDVLIGLVNRTGVVGMLDYPAAVDQTTSQGRSWIGSYGGNVPAPPTLPATSLWGTIDSLGLAGNWMIRGVGYQDVPWLSETPDNGLVLSGNSQVVDLTLDASSLAPGMYTTQLATYHDTLYPVPNVPITLTVVTGYLWNGSVNSDWNVATNWTPNGVPDGFASVVIAPANLTGAAAWPVLNVDPTVVDLTLETGAELTIPNGRSLTVNHTLNNNGLLRQEIDIQSAALTRFLYIIGSGGAAYYGVDITPENAMGFTTVEIRGNQATGCNQGDQLAQRCFDISPTTPQEATVRFWYLNSESNGEDVPTMKAFHWNGGSWDTLDAGGEQRSTVDSYEWVEVDNVSSYSPFGLADGSPNDPTAVSLQATHAITPTLYALVITALLFLTLLSFFSLRLRRR